MTLPESPFTVAETHGRAVRPEDRLVAHSQHVGWRSLYAAILDEAPLHVTEPALRHPFMIYHLTHPTEVKRKIEGAPREQAILGPGNICLTPPETITEWQHVGHPEILQVYLRRSLYEAAVGELYGCDTAAAEIVPRFGILDPLLEQLAIALADALRSGTGEDVRGIHHSQSRHAGGRDVPEHAWERDQCHVCGEQSVPRREFDTRPAARRRDGQPDGGAVGAKHQVHRPAQTSSICGSARYCVSAEAAPSSAWTSTMR